MVDLQSSAVFRQTTGKNPTTAKRTVATRPSINVTHIIYTATGPD